MSKRTLGRIAVGTAVALVAGMLPVLLAPTAAAAAPTVLTVTPSTQTVAGGGAGSAEYTIGFNNDVPPGGIYYAVTSGPDGASAPLTDALPCLINDTDATCTVTTNGTAGTDSLMFFYSPTSAPTVPFTDGAPSVEGTLIVTGPVNAITATAPATHVAQGQWAKYQLTATDANGNPIPGQGIDVSGTGPDLLLVSADPLNAFTGTVVSVPDQVASTSLATDSTGLATFWANSTGDGTINFSLTSNPVVDGADGVATLTVDPGTAQDVTQVVIDPATQTAFQDAPVNETITVLNAQGDLVGDPAALPTASITAGPNVGRPVSVTAVAGEPQGTYLAEYTTLPPSTTQTTIGTDSLLAFVNHTPEIGALGAGGPSDTATITVVARPPGPIHLDLVAPTATSKVTAFTNSTTAPVYFQLMDGNNNPLSGYGINLAVNAAASAPASQVAGYSVAPNQAVTGTDGKFLATVTDAIPLVGDVVAIDATLVGDNTITVPAEVDWIAPADIVSIDPYLSTGTIGGSASFTAATVNPAGTPVDGVDYIWQVTTDVNGPTQTTIDGTGTAFSYADSVSPTVDHQDQVTVFASQNGVSLGATVSTQYWARDGVAGQVNITLDSFGGGYTGQGVNDTLPPFTPHGFVNTLTAGVIPDPTATTPSVDKVPVGAMLADGNNNRLFGQTVTFTSSGVGAFVDQNGKVLPGNSVTARVDDGIATGPDSDPTIRPFASVFVRSSRGGVQTITATVNGISSVGTITWSGQYVPVTPFRIFDTRNGQGGVGTDPLAPDTLTFFDYARTAVPLDATAYVLNVTAVGSTGSGDLRVADSCEDGSPTRASTVPDTSLINYQAGQAVANAIVVPNECPTAISGLRVFSDSSSVNVVVDVEGYYVGDRRQALAASTPAFESLPPTRIADTRTGVNTGGPTSIAPGAHITIQVTGTGAGPNNDGIPDDAKAVAINLTAINPDNYGFLRVYPDGANPPNASNINYIPGVDKAAFAVVDIPADGKINVSSDGATIGLAVDVFGYYPSTSNVVTSSPVRVFDSRETSPLLVNQPVSVQVAGKAGIPTDAQAVLVSVTAVHSTNSTGAGFLRIYAADAAPPPTSNVNYISPTADVANFAIVNLSANGQLSLYSAGSPINALIDVVGYVPAGS